MTDIIEDISREFDIPIEEARKRAEYFFRGLPTSPMSDEFNKKKEEAMRLCGKRKENKII